MWQYKLHFTKQIKCYVDIKSMLSLFSRELLTVKQLENIANSVYTYIFLHITWKQNKT